MIFFIYLYQRWIYRIDPKRVNEFGTSQEMIDNPAAVLAADEADDTTGPLAIEKEDGEAGPPKTDAEKKEDWWGGFCAGLCILLGV